MFEGDGYHPHGISYDIPTVFVGHIRMLVGSIMLILQCLRKQEKIRNVPYRFPSSGIPIGEQEITPETNKPK
jgi:hypothetical protein